MFELFKHFSENIQKFMLCIEIYIYFKYVFAIDKMLYN